MVSPCHLSTLSEVQGVEGNRSKLFVEFPLLLGWASMCAICYRGWLLQPPGRQCQPQQNQQDGELFHETTRRKVQQGVPPQHREFERREFHGGTEMRPPAGCAAEIPGLNQHGHAGAQEGDDRGENVDGPIQGERGSPVSGENGRDCHARSAQGEQQQGRGSARSVFAAEIQSGRQQHDGGSEGVERRMQPAAVRAEQVKAQRRAHEAVIRPQKLHHRRGQEEVQHSKQRQPAEPGRQTCHSSRR